MQLLLQVRVKPIRRWATSLLSQIPLLPDDRPMIVFDHEDEDANKYTVKLTAIDATLDRDLNATLTVNIVVTNRNEAPTEPKAAPEGLRIAGDASIPYAEDRNRRGGNLPDCGSGRRRGYGDMDPYRGRQLRLQHRPERRRS